MFINISGTHVNTSKQLKLSIKCHGREAYSHIYVLHVITKNDF